MVDRDVRQADPISRTDAKDSWWRCRRAVDAEGGVGTVRYHDQQLPRRVPPLPRLEHHDRANQSAILLPHVVEVRVIHEGAGSLWRDVHFEARAGANRRLCRPIITAPSRYA